MSRLPDYEILGLPLSVDCEDTRILACADDCLIRSTIPVGNQPMRLGIDLVNSFDDARGICEAPTHSVQFGVDAMRFWIKSECCDGWADQSTGLAHASVIPTARFFENGFAVTLIETLSLFLAFGQRPTVLHAAALVEGGRTVLLTGDEGAGKSTLAYACLRTGMSLLADDVVYLSSAVEPLFVWGHPASLYLLPDAPGLFPELAEANQVDRLNGETKLRVPTLRMFPDRMSTGNVVDGVLFLKRSPDRMSKIRPVSREEIIQSLTGIKGDLALNRSQMKDIAQRIADCPSATLEAGNDPEEAAIAVRSWLSNLPIRN